MFLMSAEKAHHFTMKLFGLGLKIPLINLLLKNAFDQKNQSSVEVAGMVFPNRVGLAAGFDKDGKYLQHLLHLPFGHIEVGTVTPRPQAGNPKPRLFRLPSDRALINRMGFNNDGVDALAKRLQTFPRNRNIIIAGNIGKNKDTAFENSKDDYIICFNKLFDHVDYFTINISSPNTPGLRGLQGREPLEELLSAIQSENDKRTIKKPIFLKIAPDLTPEQIDEIIELCDKHQLNGIIATNTTISRANLNTPEKEITEIGAGGLSGLPLQNRSTEVISQIRKKMPAPFAIIGVGGIDSVESAKRKLDAGADLIQIYTGMIYSGPQLVKQLAAL